MAVRDDAVTRRQDNSPANDGGRGFDRHAPAPDEFAPGQGEEQHAGNQPGGVSEPTSGLPWLRGIESRPCERLFEFQPRVADVVQALLAVLRQAPLQQPAQPRRRAGRKRGPLRLGLDDRRENVGDGVARETRPAGQHLE